jgi:diguanylate cyclase (GGDEF)-like protein/PAS domain S-box-containing protein
MEGRNWQRMTKSQLVKELERQRNRETWLQAIERIGQIGYYEANYESNRVESCSLEYARIYGMSVEEVIAAQDSWEKILLQIHPDDREYYEKVDKAYRKGGSLDVEYRIIRKDGEIRNIREIGVRAIDDSSGIRTTFGIVQDITDHKKHAIDLENRDVLAQQAESITDIGHFIYDLITDKYVYISPGFARIHGVSCEEYLARVSSREDDIADVHADDYDRVAEVYEQHAIDGTEFSIDYRIHRADGEIRWIREQSIAHRISNGIAQQSIGVLQDITEQKHTETKLLEAKESLEATVKQRTQELESTVGLLREEVKERQKMAAELEFLANHDALTGLPSLRLCKDRLAQSLAESRRNKQISAVMFIDLDRFKEVNDKHGHEYGDLVLKVVADRIRAEIRETDTVARIGGDEFVVILSSVPGLEIIERVAIQVIDQIAQPIQVDQHDVEVSASVGIALYPENGNSPDELIRQADRAMYRVKDSGKNSFAYAVPE